MPGAAAGLLPLLAPLNMHVSAQWARHRRRVVPRRWQPVAERRFDMPVRWRDFAEFDQRMMRPTFADHRLDDAKVARVRAAFEPHVGPDGAHFTRPMHVRLLRRIA